MGFGRLMVGENWSTMIYLFVTFRGVNNSLLLKGSYKEPNRQSDSIDEKNRDSFLILGRESVFYMGNV